MSKLTITVTTEDIAKGLQFAPWCCPIARAIKRVTERAWEVDGCRAENEDGGRMILPWQAVIFQRDFDGGDTVEPFSFEVEA